jgi:hypothetical protein
MPAATGDWRISPSCFYAANDERHPWKVRLQTYPYILSTEEFDSRLPPDYHQKSPEEDEKCAP